MEKRSGAVSIYYLGVELDNKLNFGPHIILAAEKEISRLMPNFNGPSEVKRRLLMSVMHSKS